MVSSPPPSPLLRLPPQAMQDSQPSDMQSIQDDDLVSVNLMKSPIADDSSEPWDHQQKVLRVVRAAAAHKQSPVTPATQTLNNLSQSSQMNDLRYDMSQLEYDVAATLAQASTSTANPAEQQCDDPTGATANSNQRTTAAANQALAQRFDSDTDDAEADTDADMAPPPVRRRTTASVPSKSCPTETTALSTTSNKNPPPPEATQNKAVVADGKKKKGRSTTTYTSASAGTSSNTPRPLEQLDARTGVVLNTFTSIRQASERTKLKRGLLYTAIQQDTIVGGFQWRLQQQQTVPEDATMATTTMNTSNNKETASDCQHDTVAPRKIKATVDRSETKTVTTTTAMANVISPKSTPRVIGDYSIHTITVRGAGPLGLSLMGALPPTALCRLLQCPEQSRFCFVENTILDPTSLAGTAGIQKGDWFLSVLHPGDTTTIPELQTIHDVVKVAKNAERPVTFSVARKSDVASIADKPKSKATLQQPLSIHASSEDEDSFSGIKQVTATISGTTSRDVATASVQTQQSRKISIAAVSSRPKNVTVGKAEPKTGTGVVTDTPNVVPFCALCNGRKTTHLVHHPWCPKREDFVKSGAKEILERIQQGVRMQCDICIQEYKAGRSCKGEEHSKDCQSNQKILDAIHVANDSPPASPTKALKKRKPQASPKDKPRPSTKRSKAKEESLPTTSRGRRIRISEKFRASEANLSDVGGDDDSLSVYDGGTDSIRPMQTLLIAQKPSKTDLEKRLKAKSKVATKNASVAENVGGTNRKQATNERGKATGKPSKSSSKSAPKKTSKKRTDASGAGTAKETTRKSEHPNPVPRRTAGQQPVQDNDHSDVDEIEIDDLSDGPLAVAWEQVGGNPWGPEGHVDDDVVLFENASGLGHHEAVLPSLRYEADPFTSGKRYIQTHRTPQEGFQALVLMRDPLDIRPWGFMSQRHEFGGACLVSSVDPLSPADAAVSGHRVFRKCPGAMSRFSFFSLTFSTTGVPRGGKRDIF